MAAALQPLFSVLSPTILVVDSETKFPLLEFRRQDEREVSFEYTHSPEQRISFSLASLTIRLLTRPSKPGPSVALSLMVRSDKHD